MEEDDDSWYKSLLECRQRLCEVESRAIDVLWQEEGGGGEPVVFDAGMPGDDVNDVWDRLFHARIVRLREQLRVHAKAKTRAAGADSQGKERREGGEDKIRNSLTNIIAAGTEMLFALVHVAEVKFFRNPDMFKQFWSYLFTDLSMPSLSDIPCLLGTGTGTDAAGVERSGSLNLNGVRVHVCMFCARCLQRIGDLQRYKAALFTDNVSSVKYNTCARMCYNNARLLCPILGSSYNQLALVDASTGINLWSTYHYAQAASAISPAEKSGDNLLLVLRRYVSRKHVAAPKSDKEKMLLLFCDTLGAVLLPSPPAMDFAAALRTLHDGIVTFFSAPSTVPSKPGKNSVEEKMATLFLVITIFAERSTVANEERHALALTLLCVIGSALMQLDGTSLPKAECNKFVLASVALHILLMWFTNTRDGGLVSMVGCPQEVRNSLWTEAALLLNATRAAFSLDESILDGPSVRPSLSVLYEESELLGFAPTARHLSEEVECEVSTETIPFSMRMKVISDRNVAFPVRAQAVYKLAKATAALDESLKEDGYLFFDAVRKVFTTKRPSEPPAPAKDVPPRVASPSAAVCSSSDPISDESSDSCMAMYQHPPPVSSSSIPSAQPMSIPSGFIAGEEDDMRDASHSSGCNSVTVIPSSSPLKRPREPLDSLPDSYDEAEQEQDMEENKGDDADHQSRDQGHDNFCNNFGSFNPFWIQEEFVRTSSSFLSS